MDGVHVHLTNTSNLPAEALEMEYPLTLLRYELVDGSGGTGKQRGGMYIKPNDMPAPPSWMPYAHVPNADKGFALAKATGAQQMTAPMDVPGGSRIAAVIDPAGAMFAVHSMPAVAPSQAPAP